MTLRIGVIGSGGRAAGCLQAFADLDGSEPVALAARNPVTGKALAGRFLADVAAAEGGEETGWRQDLQCAYDAAQIGWAAERSVAEGNRINL